ncbi:MAG: hypothetical protein WCP99_00700 [Burkholderiales bacterium]
MALQSFDSFGFGRDILTGVLMLALVLAFHGYWLTRIAFRYELNSRLSFARQRPQLVFVHFYLAVMALALVHVAAVVLWALALTLSGLVTDFSQSVLFSGSCYTTVGFMDNILPVGWKFAAIIITLSGLFSMAWSTSMMISMTDHFREAWIKKHEDLVRKIMDSDKREGK